MTPKEIDIALGELEERVDRLRALYESYFMGYEKLEPTVPRKEVDRRFVVLRKENIRNTAQRFKFNVLTQKFNTYAMYWGRICRQIEEGTYKRHVQRAKKRFGDEARATRDREERETTIDVDLTDFEAQMETGGDPGFVGGDDDLDALLDAALDGPDRKSARVELPAPPSQPEPVAAKPASAYRPALAPGGDAKRLVRKKDGTLGPVTPATPMRPVGPIAAPAPTPAPTPAPAGVSGTGRFPAALPPTHASTPRVPESPSTGRLPAAPPPGGPRPAPMPAAAKAPTSSPAPTSSGRLPAAPPPGGPRLPAAPPPGAPARVPGAPVSSQRLPAAPPPGGPVSSPRLPAAPPPGGPVSSPRLPAAPPPGGPPTPRAPQVAPTPAASAGRLPAAPPPGAPGARSLFRPAPAVRPAPPREPDGAEKRPAAPPREPDGSE